ncbi:MAG: response regulator, partial [Clostridiales bacterium]|nr:response regulator [Clostridiales bacterium]
MYKLLIVDDERFVVDSLYSLLEGRQDLDLEISTAYSGKQALSHLEQCKTDIVILDVKMPVVDGLQVYERISVLWPDIYVIFLTGYANFDYIYPVNKEENVIYLLKTEDFDTIVNTVQTMIDRIEKNRNTLTMIDRADRMETLAKQLLSGEVLNGLISGKPLADIQNQLAWFSEEYAFDLDRPIFLMYYRIKWRDISSYSSFTYNEQLMYLTQYIKRVLNNRFSVASHKINMSSSILFLQPVFDYGLAVPPAIYLKENLNEMVELGQRNFIFDVLALLYTRELSWEGIYVIYESLRTYFRCAIEPEIPKYGLGIVVGQHELRKISSQECPSEESNYSTLLDQVSYALYDRNRQGLIAALKQLENTFPPHKGMDDLTTICIYQSISNILIQYINRNNLYKKIGRDIGLYKLYSLNAF